MFNGRKICSYRNDKKKSQYLKRIEIIWLQYDTVTDIAIKTIHLE